MRSFGFLVVVFTLLFPMKSYADLSYTLHGQTGNMNILPLTSCAAAVGARTFDLPPHTPKNFALALFHIRLTAATDMTLQCSTSVNDGLGVPQTLGKLQVCDNVTGGVCNLIDAKFMKTVPAPEELIVRVDFLGSEEIRCVFSCTSGSFQIWGRMSGR